MRVLTCAHVVAACVSSGEIWVAFPRAGAIERRRVVEAIPPQGVPGEIADVALLILDRPAPDLAASAPLRSPLTGALVGEEWWAFGFPQNDPLGSAAHGTVGSGSAYGWVRLETASRYVVEEGFSGGGLWSPRYRAVVGLVGQAERAGPRRGDGRALALHQIAAWLPGEKLTDLTTWSPEDSGDRALAAWGWSLSVDREGTRHWRPRARGVAVDSETGYRFRGRTAALTVVVDWLDRSRPDRRALIVTGSPGVGKSAVLGRVVTTADAEIRAVLPDDDVAVKAGEGSVACAVHVKGKTALEVAVEIARAASLTLPEQVDDLAPALRTAMEQPPHRGRRFNVILDALDEANSPAEARLIATRIVQPLVETCSPVGVQVVVGTRRRDGEGDLITALGVDARMVDLDQPEFFEAADLVAYALSTLQLQGDTRDDNPYTDLSVAEPVATRIANLAVQNFLIAGLVARTHGLHDREAVAPAAVSFAPSVEAALRLYLDRLPTVAGIAAADLLAVLAFAEAPGLPLSLWQIGLGAWNLPITTDQLNRFAHTAGANFLVEGIGGIDRRFQLFHQALNEALNSRRAELHDRVTDQARLTCAWTEYGRQDAWASAPPYLLRNLAVHAAEAGLIDDLLTDDHYLRFADLRRLAARADDAVTQAAQSRAQLLHLTPNAANAPAPLRSAMLSYTSQVEGIEPPYPVMTNSPYSAPWAHVAARHERTTLAGHTSAVTALCAMKLSDGRSMIVSGGAGGVTVDDGDSTVRVWDPVTGAALHVLKGHTDGVSALCAVQLPDGRSVIASSGGRDGGGGDDSTVRVWDPVTGAALYVLKGNTGGVTALCAVELPDGRTVIASSGGGVSTVRLWDPVTGAALHVLKGHTGRVTALCSVQLPDGRTAIASSGAGAGGRGRGRRRFGRGDSTVRVWDPVTGAALQVMKGHTDGVSALCAVQLPDGRSVIASSGGSRRGDWTVRVWDPVTGAALHVLKGHTGGVSALCSVHLPDGRTAIASSGGGLALGSGDCTVRVWDPVTGAALQVLKGHNMGVTALCAVELPDGRTVIASSGVDVAYGSGDSTVRVWDPVTGAALHVLMGHTGGVTALCAVELPGDRWMIATSGRDRTVRMWDPVKSSRRRMASDHQLDAYSLCQLVLRDGRSVIASSGLGSGDSTVRVWDPVTGAALHVLKGHTGGVSALCSVELPDGRTVIASGGGGVAFGNGDSTVRVWDPVTGAVLHVLKGHTGGLNALCSVELPDGKSMIASGGAGRSPGGGGGGGGDSTVRVWDPVTGAALHVLKGHNSGVSALCAVRLPDGRTVIASGGSGSGVDLGFGLGLGLGDSTVRVWDPVTGAALHVLKGHNLGVTALCAVELPDGRTAIASSGGTIAVSSGDCTVWVWDPVTGAALHALEGHTGGVTALCAVELPDGRKAIASGGGGRGGGDSTVRVWDPVTGAALHVLKGHTDGVTALCAVDLLGRQVLMSAAADGTLQVWDLRSSDALLVVDLHHRPRAMEIVENSIVVTLSAGIVAIQLYPTQDRSLTTAPGD